VQHQSCAVNDFCCPKSVVNIVRSALRINKEKKMIEYIILAALVAGAFAVVYKMLTKKETATEAVAEVAKEAESAAAPVVKAVEAKVEEAVKAEVTEAKTRAKKAVVKALDVNNDGKVDIADAVEAVKKTTRKKKA
jgi:hypothetical protein